MDQMTSEVLIDDKAVEGLPRNARKLRNTLLFSDALKSFDERLATTGLNRADRSAREISQTQEIPAVDTNGTNAGLPHNSRKLQHVVRFNSAMDAFGESAQSSPLGDLPIAIQIGAKLRAARLALGLTQATLAARTGILQGTISEIEKGKSPNGPNCATVDRLATALRLKVELVPMDMAEAAD